MIVRVDYQRPGPHLARPTFWTSDLGGFVEMAIWIVGFLVAAVLMQIFFAVL